MKMVFHTESFQTINFRLCHLMCSHLVLYKHLLIADELVVDAQRMFSMHSNGISGGRRTEPDYSFMRVFFRKVVNYNLSRFSTSSHRWVAINGRI